MSAAENRSADVTTWLGTAAFDACETNGLDRPAAEILAPRAGLRAEDIVVTVFGDLAAVEAEWRCFEQTADCSVFQTFDWLSIWQAQIGNRCGVQPAIAIGRERRGEVLFIMPLAVYSSVVVRQLCWLGSDSCDYNAPLLAPQFSARLNADEFEIVWRNILRAVRRDLRLFPNLIRLEKMPAKIGRQANPFLAFDVRENASRAYCTPLASSWNAFYGAKRSAATRSRDRTKRNRLAKFGEIKLDNAENAAAATAMIDTLVDQKSRAFARMGQPNLFARPGHIEFYRALAGAGAGKDVVHVSALRVGSDIAAANLGLSFRGCYHHHLASHGDGQLSRFGPGIFHLHELMRHAIENGCTSFDFTIGDEPYKRDWCDGAQELYDYVSVITWRGAFAYLRTIVFLSLKRLIKRTPVLWSFFSKARAQIGGVR